MQSRTARTTAIVCLLPIISVIKSYAVDMVVNTDELASVVATKDIPQIIAVLPKIELLWPQQPDTYFQFVKNATDVIGPAASNNVSARIALTNAFANLIRKDIATNSAIDARYIDVQCDQIECLLGWSIVRNDKTSWLMVAKYIGRIREQIIVDYTNRGRRSFSQTIANRPLNDDQKTNAISQLQENERNKKLDSFQFYYRMVNERLSFGLTRSVIKFGTNATEKIEYINKIAPVAHLSSDEIGRLH